ncbi:MAG: DNA phosphorothioation system sulfurtransferase DndC [Tissierellaceae bacterium]|nr:DNA phosphorothioation system sulfurtransferase DndC [Tissierellaceae bacterium]
MSTLSKQDIQEVIKIIQTLYLEDNIPWICGYSGGKDSTAIVQLVWEALSQLPETKRHKKVHVISTDTLVESPVVALWANTSLERMKENARKGYLPIIPHRLTPQTSNTYWVNLIGRGYPYPRKNFRWCTDRMKIEPSNTFIKKILDAESEAILVLGSRKAESATRRAVMEGYEKKRYRDHLSPNGSFPNSYIFTPIENWTNDNVWQYLMQIPNPWGHSNKELLAMYSGASADGECPLVFDTGTPSCGNSRFGCWVCTLVTEDKSMAAMIQNDEEKSWMLPLLDFRNDIATMGDPSLDRKRRDFRRMNGKLTWHHGRLVHGPYTKETREEFLRKLLRAEKVVHENGPEEVKDVPLITQEELQFIRKIWLEEKHEFDDRLPLIYEEETGKVYEDNTIYGNKYYGAAEWDLLKEVCESLYPKETLLLEMQSSILDIESKSSAMSQRRNIKKRIEEIIVKCYFTDEDNAEEIELERRKRRGIIDDVLNDEDIIDE